MRKISTNQTEVPKLRQASEICQTTRPPFKATGDLAPDYSKSRPGHLARESTRRMRVPREPLSPVRLGKPPILYGIIPHSTHRLKRKMARANNHREVLRRQWPLN